MERFFYTVRDKTNKRITGYEEANSEEELIARLQAKELIVVNVMPELKEGVKAINPLTTQEPGLALKHYGVTSEDLVLFCRQLSLLLSAGVTILRCFDILSKQVSSRKLYNVIKDVRKNMEHGLSLHEAMSKHPKVFSDLWVNLVESGEAGGNLSVVLTRLASYLERNAVFKKKVISALIYPCLLLFAGTGALLFLTIKIIPTFAELFKGFNIDLPFLTQVLISMSEFLRKSFLFIIVAIIIGFFMLKKYISTKEGRIFFERIMFKLPIFGEFFKAIIIERFSSNMSTLLESGVPILYSLEITERSVANIIVADIVRQAKEDVRAGKSLSQPLDRSGFFEPMVVQMIAIGEEIGELSQMFKRINTFYQEYVETFLGRFTSLFEPIMLVFMGLVIGAMVIGMFLPIFQIARIGGR